MNDAAYVEQLKARMLDRLTYVKNLETNNEGYDKLPEDAMDAIRKVVDQLG